MNSENIQPLHKLFERQVQLHPEKVALVFEGKTLTYRELNSKANRLARHLQAIYPMKPDTLIALCLERNEHMIIAILAVLKAGGAYVPIDPHSPKERIDYILQDSSSKILLINRGSTHQFENAVVEVDDDNIFEFYSSEDLSCVDDSSQLAYVIYTSGTTGKPKGVLQTHFNVARLFEVTQEKFNFSEADTWTLFHSYAFDFSVWEIWGALLFGGKLVLLSSSQIQDFRKIYEVCDREQVTVLNQTPTAFYSFIDVASLLPKLKSLRVIIFGGEKLNITQLKGWISEYGLDQPRLINMYGITETTVHATFKEIVKEDLQGSISIGHMLPDMHAHVLDDDLSPVEFGTIGELYIGGAGLARGYLNKPELTKERFITNPFDPGSRLYKTGDLVKVLPNGELAYIGRSDFQVKIRGHRIELGEIENALLGFSTITKAIVTTREYAQQLCLIAYYVSNTEIDKATVFEFLQRKLPSYMMPSFLVQMEEFPRTINGKIDLKKLPEPIFDNSELNPPRTYLEKELHKIWTEILGISPINIHESFFRLGGDSMRAIKIIHQIRSQLKLSIEPSALLHHPTIAKLAIYLDKNVFEQSSIEVFDTDAQKLSFAQERFWFIEKYEEGSRAYNIPLVFKIKNNTDVNALKTSLKAIIQRHQSLRTLIKEDLEGSSFQEIDDGERFVIAEFSHVDIAQLDSALEQRINHVYNLQNEYPILVSLHKVPDAVYLCIVVHHIAFDGWSMDLFLLELEAFYNHVNLPPLKFQYKDFAVWQRNHLTSEFLQPQLSYWKEKIAQCEPLNLPTDYPRPLEPDFKGHTLRFSLNPEISEGLRELAKILDISLYTVLFAGFCLTLKIHSNQSQFIIGTPIADRQVAGTEHLIGLFINTLALKVEIPSDEFFNWLQDLGREIKEAQLHQDVPFEKLIEVLKVPKDPSRHPLFQVMFGIQNFGTSCPSFLEPYDVEDHLYAAAKFDISTFMDDSQQILKGSFNYAQSLFEESTISRYIHTYQEILRQFSLKCSNKKVADFHGLTAEDYQQIALEWNDTDVDFPRQTMHEIFEEQVRSNPHHVAVYCEGKQLTYQELNEQANQLASYLRENFNIKPDTLIAFCLDRNEQMLVVILGILKAGAAYVPIDPHYPDERIRYILEDTNCQALFASPLYQRRLEGLFSKEIITKTRFDDQPKNNLVSLSSAKDLAYVIYTSGTTGKPKGVMIEHEGVVNFALFYKNKYQFNAETRISQFLSLAFDAAGSEIYSSLFSGSTLYIIPDELKLDVDALARFVEDHRISFSIFPPAILAVLPCFRHPMKIVIMGDSCPIHVIEKWIEAGHQMINGYGPTETTIGAIESTYYDVGFTKSNNIGKPIANKKVYVLDENKNLKPVGAPGELYIGGVGIARGYLNNPALTNEKFIQTQNGKLYKTGDLVQWLPNGDLEYLHRNDFQVKIRGYRIELAEIETALSSYPGVKQGLVIAKESENQEKYLIGYYTAVDPFVEKEMIQFLNTKLPHFMVPQRIIHLEKIPRTANDKVDRNALPLVEEKKTAHFSIDDQSSEQKILLAWSEVLGKEPSSINLDDNFFDIGGNSILLIRLKVKIEQLLSLKDFKISTLFKYPTIRSFHSTINAKNTDSPVSKSKLQTGPIAIVGLSCEFPHAKNKEEYWEGLSSGKELTTHFKLEQCKKLGGSKERLQNQNFISVEGALDNLDHFDHDFWNLSRNDASLMDPQIRKFTEHAWIALESAGEIQERDRKKIGIFAGANDSQYSKNRSVTTAASDWEIQIGTDKDFLATRASYLLGLTGPSINIATACSTSLVSVVEACKSLTLNVCDVALAGGISLNMPENYGYHWEEGLIFSKDGKCRPFDEQSSGTIRGSGVGIVVLKRLEDAIKDNNNILAVIKGYASNNDGNRKVGYTAPSIIGQTECILEAQRSAGVTSDTIDYVECHGTATALGDMIEVQALHDAFQRNSSQGSYQCRLGAVKANIGHANSAAGIAGLIKVCMMLKARQMPPQIHFSTSNRALNLDTTSFNIGTTLEPWDSKNSLRRAGVSSFGIGGTNAHIVLEEHVATSLPVQQNGRFFILPLSAKSKSSLRMQKDALVDYLTKNPKLGLQDLAYSLQHKREHFSYREAIVCQEIPQAIEQLNRLVDPHNVKPTPSLILMFPGQGNQSIHMAHNLYLTEPRFKHNVDQCCEILSGLMKLDFKECLYPNDGRDLLQNTKFCQPAIFTISYSLAKFLEELNIHPSAYIGHSIGEYVAATLSGVFTLEEALHIVVQRGSFMQAMSKGSMIALQITETRLLDILPETLEIAVYNSPENFVVGGTEEEIDKFCLTLQGENITYSKLHTSHGFHTRLMNGAADQLKSELEAISLKAPKTPFISNVTGEFADTNVLSPDYWSDHLKNPVQFSKGIETLLKRFSNPIFLEIGPGKGLSHFVKQQQKDVAAISILPSAKEHTKDLEQFYQFQSMLWTFGFPIDWSKIQGKGNFLTDLPPYSFEKTSCWLKPQMRAEKNWLYYPTWERAIKLTSVLSTPKLPWIIFKDKDGFLDSLIHSLQANNESVFVVEDEDGLIELVESRVAHVIHASQSNQSLKNLQNVLPHLREGSCFILLSNGINQVLGNDQIEPSKGPLLGAFRSMVHESPHVKASFLDIGFQPTHLHEAITYLISSPKKAPFELNHSLRFGSIWEEKIHPLSLGDTTSKMTDGDVILMSGGFGGISLAVAKEISKHHQVTFLLFGRHLPTEQQKLDAIDHLKQNGCKLQTFICDVSNLDDLTHCLEKYPKIDAVIHTAGEITNAMKAKALGAENLYQLFKEKKLKFFAMTSSLASCMGDIGRGEYCAANSYLDALSRIPNSPFPLLSINWTGWQTGMSKNSEFLSNNLLSESEGAAIFYKLLNQATHNQVLVTKYHPRMIQNALDSALLEEGTPETERELIETGSDLEEKLAGIYHKILGNAQFSKYDSFFELGGSSLSAIRLINLLKKDLHEHINLEILYQYSSVHQLAEYLKQKEIKPQVEIHHSEKSAAPLSFAQERLWFMESFEQGSHAYNIPMVFKVVTRNFEKIEEALRGIVNRHEVLRTFIREDGTGKGVQVVDGLNRFEIEKITCATSQDFEKIIEARANRVYNLAVEYPIQAALIVLQDESYLSLTVHHIAFDGWSIDLFLQEFQAFYDGTGVQLPQLSIQYKDFAVWQRKDLEGERFNVQMNYWKKRLQQHETLNLITDKPRPSHINYQGKNLYFELDEKTSIELRLLAKQLNVSLYSVLLAGYTLLLKAYSNQKEILLGIPVANRHYPNVENLIGFFVNSLPLKISLDTSLSIAEFIQQIGKEIVEAQLHQDLPFEKLIENLEIPRDTSRHPLFQVMFGVQNFGKFCPNFLEHFPIDNRFYNIAKFDISTFIDDHEPVLKGFFNYATSLYEEPTVAKMVETYSLILKQFVQKDLKLSELCILSDKDQTQILEVWNATDKPFSYSAVHQLFEEQAALNPDQIAAIDGDQQISYKELNEQANQLAHYLNIKIGSNRCIAFCLDRTVEMLIVMLGILKAGGAYVPIDPTYPDEKIKQILNDTNSPLVFTHEQNRIRLQALTSQEIVTDLGQFKDLPKTNLHLSIPKEHVAYVIYTSGTTGKSKGVMIQHQALFNYIANIREHLALSQIDTVDLSTSIGFDLTVTNSICSLCLGAKIALFKGDIRDLEAYKKHLVTQKITFVKHVPSFFNLLKDFLPETEIRKVILGGEKFNPQIVKHLNINDLSIYDEYGPTESTVGTCINQVYPIFKPGIGKPYHNYKIYVLDEDQKPIPAGVIGELYIGGLGLAKGYLNQEALTDQKFVPNPFQNRSKLYKTGDLVKWLPDGTLEYIGRNDSQIKLRGYRIELGEIETLLASHPGISEVAVAVQHNSLVAYYRSETKILESLLINYLQLKLPEYAIPTHFVSLDHFPLTVNGKLDIKALPIPHAKQISYKPPRNALEKSLCALWRDLLNINGEIGIKDDFFKLGGDSITCIQFVSRVRQQHRLHLSIKDIFLHKTIEKLSDHVLVKDLKNPQIQAELGILEGPLPLLPIQEWFFANKFSHQSHWNQAFLIRTKELNIEQLASSLSELINHHDAFRMRFGEHPFYDSKAPQEILSVENIATLKEGSLELLLSKWQQGFNLEKGPLYHIGYIHGFKDGTSRIHFAFHHLIVDTVSWRILIQHLKSLYEGKQQPAKLSSYRQWAMHVRDYATVHQKQKEFWENLISDFRFPAFATTESKHTLSIKFDIQQTKQLTIDCCKTYHTQIQDLLLTALGEALYQTSNQSVHHIVLEGHGRESFDTLDVTETMGWFTTLYPICLKFSQNLIENIIQVKESLRKIPDKGIGYGALMGYTSHSLPPIAFNYLGQFEEKNNNDWQITHEPCGLTIAKENSDPFLLTVWGLIKDECLEINFDSQLQLTNDLAFIFKETLEKIIEQTTAPKRTFLTPSDINYLVNQDILDHLQKDQEIENLYLASSLQQGMISHTLTQDYDDAYIVQQIWQYHSKIDPERLKEAWIVAQKTYGALRLRFSWRDELIQIIDKEGMLNFQYLDYSHEIDPEKTIQEFITKDRKIPFDLEMGSLFRIHLIKEKENLYRSILTYHHAILDGWSTPLLLAAVHNVYQNHLIPSTDHSYEAAQKYLQENKSQHLEFWQNYLHQLDAKLDLSSLLAFEKRDTKLHSYKHILNPACETLVIEESLCQELKEFGKDNGVTLNILLQYAWHKTLSIYGQNQQTIIGVVCSGRNLPIDHVENSIGLLIHTVPFIVNHSNETIIETLQTVQNNFNEINSKCHVPLVHLQANGERLFDTLWIFENYPIPSQESLPITTQGSKEKYDYPIVLNIYEKQKEIVVDLNYAGELFEKETMCQLLSLTEFLLKQLIKNPSDLQYLDDSQTQQIIYDWNETDLPIDSPTLPFHFLFERQVQCTPDKVAVLTQNARITYRELNEKANQLAHYLKSNYSIKPDTIIAFCFSRNEKILIAILAILKAGGAYVAIDPEFPADRINAILQETESSVILTEESCRLYLPKYPLISLDDPILTTQSLDAIEPSPDHLMYVLYTSGTTGKPKGVMIEQGSFTVTIQSIKQLYFKNKNSINTYSLTNYTFDIFGLEFGLPLTTGGFIEIGSKGFETLDCSSYDFIQMTPSLCELKVDLLNQTSDTLLLVGGEKLKLELLNKILDKGMSVVNVYGPTETTIWSTSKLYQANPYPQVVTIGKPLPFEKAYVLDNYLKPVPIGAFGELYIGGAGLARGYLNQASVTNEKFILNPFVNGNEKFYKTGDIVRFLPNCELEYLGRHDNQVKINGYRIELGEIESALLSLHGIQQAVVTVKNGSLVGYYIAAKPMEEAHLFEQLSTKLPHYMLPHSLIFLDQLPLNVNGKLNIDLLPQPNAKQAILRAPSNALESSLLKIWANILCLPESEIGVDTDFFSLGGNSISAIKLMNKIQSTHPSFLKISDLYVYRTIASLASKLSETKLLKSTLIQFNQKDPTNPILFMIHPAMGGCEVYHSLARLLENDFCCYGIDSHNLYHEHKIESLSSLANHYLNSIDQIPSPTKEYHLLGWSMGGLIAFEIASLLEKRQDGSTIYLYLLDTFVYDDYMHQLSLEFKLDEQKKDFTNYALKNGIEQSFIEKAIANMALDNELTKQRPSEPLKSTEILLFKALERDTRSLSEDYSIPHEYVLKLPYNNIDKFTQELASIKLFELKNFHHGNILEAERILMDQILQHQKQLITL